ncbi:TRAP transporter small permease [Antarcticibacterium sp. 1MA-6-2]|uniref:TRAP transporter small permease n=1 Tax=Antarcticibacterium sp. 1MA-6-2 TaxID=2908210 RepID=UPI001F2108FF|nr:TRAP transporter small permease [Antarcticibacterium sp. 1MA-6-2]UJH90654.1 TRAP transporter small permease [Antarcticibacterium sp. 1MA-6-2]
MRKNLNLLLEWIVVILLIVMLLSVLWGVLTRYIYDDQSTWTDELARFMLIWVSILGAAYVSGKNAHIAIDLLPATFSKKKKFLLDIMTSIIITVFVFVTFLVGGLRYIYISFKLGQTSAALEIPMGYVYLVLPVAGALIIYFKILAILDARKALKLID